MTDSVKFDPDWLSMPDLVRDEIMMKVGLDNLESLHRCRQVCRAWNKAILTNIWESPSKRNIIKMRIEKIWGPSLNPYSVDILYTQWRGNSRG